ncbi:ABC transporter permease, partial [Bradyrhizobium sp.]
MTPLPILKLVFAALVILFLLGPLIAVLPLSLTDSVFLNYPIPGYSTRWFRELVTADSWRLSIVNSLLIGAGTTALATLLGTLAAL